MAVVDSSATPDTKPIALPKDLLETIFNLVESHDRRVTVPLVCKAWRHTILPSESTRRLWEDVEIRDVGTGGILAHGRADPGDSVPVKWLKQQVESIRQWLSDRRGCVAKMTVSLSTATAGCCTVPPWGRAFGLALPALATSPALKMLSIHGPGITNSGCATFRPAPENTEAEAVGTVLQGAFSLASLEELCVVDIPWGASLCLAVAREASSAAWTARCGAGASTAALPPHPLQLSQLTNLRCLIINRSFYSDNGGAELDWLDGGAVKAWAALGEALAALPHLERLDLSYTHAMAFCDPARGAAPLPWPPLRHLKELSLAHDLSIQPPPRPPTSAAALASGSGDFTSSSAVDEGAAGLGAGSSASSAAGDIDIDMGVPFGREQMEAEGRGWLEAFLDPPMLTVESTHALVELHSWLPGCTALTSLDLRHCGLEAVPLAVVHLPLLARLDLYGNPLASMRLPSPLRNLIWLRFSLDPCYDMLYDMLAVDIGEGAAVEDMFTVELLAPQLEELQVDSTSSRALDLLRESASTIPTLRRLVLQDKSADLLR